VYAWYWGHEHLLAIYDPHPTWGLLARCVGHGGYPYFRPRLDGVRSLLKEQHELVRVATEHAPTALILDGPNPYLGRLAERYGPNGYMTIELQDDRLHESVRSPQGTPLWETTLN
jgi:hypothetical protein